MRINREEMRYLAAILAVGIGGTILRSQDIVQRSPHCRRTRSPDFVLILGQPAKTFTINLTGMSSNRCFCPCYLFPITVACRFRHNRPSVGFSLRTLETRFRNLEESICIVAPSSSLHRFRYQDIDTERDQRFEAEKICERPKSTRYLMDSESNRPRRSTNQLTPRYFTLETANEEPKRRKKIERMEGNPDIPCELDPGYCVDSPAAHPAVTTALSENVCHPRIMFCSFLLALLFILVSVSQPTGFRLPILSSNCEDYT